jgi:Protein of unknown function (DUF3567)
LLFVTLHDLLLFCCAFYCTFLRSLSALKLAQPLLCIDESKGSMLISTAFTQLTGHTSMHMLYDSDSFVVVHMKVDAQDAGASEANAPGTDIGGVKAPVLARDGFEIVDKRSGKEVYLDGSWAELFQQQINAWQAKTPTQEEVEDTLDRYSELAHNPVVLH